MFSHVEAPDYLRTKPDPLVEQAETDILKSVSSTDHQQTVVSTAIRFCKIKCAFALNFLRDLMCNDLYIKCTNLYNSYKLQSLKIYFCFECQLENVQH